MESSVSQERNATTGIVVLGLGNILQGDDGAGVYAIERLKSRQNTPANVDLVDGGTLSFTLLDIVEGRDVLIVIDAMQMNADPGTTEVYIDDELDEFLAAPMQRNVHDLNLGDLLRMCALRGTLPRHRALIGIQPEVITWQEEPTRDVSNGIDHACDIIDELIRSWSHGNT
jgi:hydrogenase maturation protease